MPRKISFSFNGWELTSRRYIEIFNWTFFLKQSFSFSDSRHCTKKELDRIHMPPSNHRLMKFQAGISPEKFTSRTSRNDMIFIYGCVPFCGKIWIISLFKQNSFWSKKKVNQYDFTTQLILITESLLLIFILSSSRHLLPSIIYLRLNFVFPCHQVIFKRLSRQPSKSSGSQVRQHTSLTCAAGGLPGKLPGIDPAGSVSAP